MIEHSRRQLYLKQLEQACRTLSLDINEDKLLSLLDYLELLVKWNKAYNLTAIRSPDDMLVKHIIDSLSIVPFIKGCELADIGTGAGLPGIPLAILFPDKRFTLVDSNGKKTRFLTQVKMTLKLDNVTVIHGRVEQIPAEKSFDQITSRAFTALDNMVTLCKHLLTDDGEFIAMKGLYPTEEIAVLTEGYSVQQSVKLVVPGCEDSRHLIIITKTN